MAKLPPTSVGANRFCGIGEKPRKAAHFAGSALSRENRARTDVRGYENEEHGRLWAGPASVLLRRLGPGWPRSHERGYLDRSLVPLLAVGIRPF